MAQILFLLGLFLFGLYVGMLFKREIPVFLIASSGFLWGALFWVAGGMITLVASIPYTPISMAVYYSLLLIGFGVLHARNKTWRISRRDFLDLLPAVVLFILVLILANQFNFSYVSSDSISQLTTGRRIAYEGLSPGVIEELSLRGIFLSQLQSASVFLGEGYLSAAQPAFALSFILVFYTLSQRILGHLTADKKRALWFAALSSLALFSTYFVVFQFFYIHNSLISAVYLYLAVGAFWLASVEKVDSWMVLGILALLGFSLARNEAPLFGLIFLVPVLSAGQASYRIRLRTILPYLGFLALWYSYLLARMGLGTKILDPEKTLVIIGALLAFGFLTLVSEWKWIKSLLLPHLPKIMVGALGLLLVYMLIQRPDHMLLSWYVLLKNLLGNGWWGLTWVLLPFALVLSLAGSRLPREELISIGITGFFGLLLGIVYFRNPFRLGWGDSANRMITHIFPIVVLYIMMKLGKNTAGSDNH